MTDTAEQRSQALQAAAEAELAKLSKDPLLPETDTQRLLHDLHVHQIELEMQNESLKLIKHELEVSRDLYRELYEFAPIGYFTLSADAMIEKLNLTATKLLGQERKHLLHRRFMSFISHEEQQRWLHCFTRLKEHGGEATVELPIQRRDGTFFHAQLNCVCQAADTINGGIRLAMTDISERKQAERALQKDQEDIKRLAFYDPLTHLPNRRLLFDRLTQAMHTAARTDQHGALMFLDLDHFKLLNDNLGHDIGDLLLQQVAERLQTCVREGDSVARMGGDEFVLLLEALSVYPTDAAAQAEAIAIKVIAALGRPYTLREHTYMITSSIGIVIFLNQDESIDTLMKKADVAMYQAKSAGRNTSRFYDASMQAAATVRVSLEKSMRRGLELNEFMLHYQLQVNNQGIPIGAEALARWNHSEYGIISPNVFIPMAEETGMILALGQWVLETACAQLAEWAMIPEKQDWTLAVNVSSLQFAQANFVATVDAALQKTGANPHLLKLELTESMLLKDIDDVIIKMFDIKALGIIFSLDDFGTGYSSLSYLKRLPLAQLKIDQSFVRDLMTDPNDAVIARTIIALGHSLSLSVIAEGVETKEQHAVLKEMGCDAYQGFYFAHPVHPHDLTLAASRIPQ